MGVSAEQREHAVTRAGKIFVILRDAAARAEVCPTNAVLAERFGCGEARVCAAFDFLEANGMIEVERGQSNRVVTIRATGAKTAGAVRSVHSSRREAA